MNKKIILLLATTFLLASCGAKKNDTYVYIGPNQIDTSYFDYDNKDALGTGLSELFVISEQTITSQSLSTFLSIIDSNDYYANKVVRTYTNQVLYPSETEPNNPNSRTDGDFDYKLVNSFTRDNAAYSVSGTSTIHDEKWTLGDSSSVVSDTKNATGTYSLAISSEENKFTEVYSYDVTDYNSSNEKTFNSATYYKLTNLTKYAGIADYLQDSLSFIDEQSASLSSSEQFSKSFIAYRDGSSFEIVLNSKSSRTTASSDVLEVSYYVDIKVANGMIIETTYQYSEIEKGSNDFVLKFTKDHCEFSHI